MLNDLRKYDCLGTPNYFFELLNTIRSSNNNWSLNDLEKLFFNKVIDGRPIIDGGINLGIGINVLQKNGEKIWINPAFEKHINSITQMKDSFNQYLFEALKNDSTFLNIFSSKYLSHDIIYKSLQLDNSAFGFKYSNFKQLLLDFQAISKHPTPQFNSFIVNQRYKKLFDKAILPEIKKRKIGIQELKKSVEQQQIYGEEAEKFVLEYETIRLQNKKKVDWVAEYIANEGYDIASYDDIDDMIPNRFIEVKSYNMIPSFHWTRNEMDVARLKKDQYFIYLVDRSKMRNPQYEPLTIQNPYAQLIEQDHSNWNKTIEKIRFQIID